VSTFVHIADERDSAAIRRTGLRLPRRLVASSSKQLIGIFALPVTPNFVVTHQWVREIKKRGFRVAVGVYFRIPDNEPVWAGRYNEQKAQMTAAQAAAVLARDELLGFEVIVPRSIQASEIHAVRQLPQGLGWRHFPDAHRKGIFCGCEYCQRGQIKSRKIRERYEQDAL
jgi:hypothetical protein